MRKTIITLVVALASLVPGGVMADGMPPSSSKPAGSEPATAPSRVTQADLAADAPDQYTVVKGDTLWGIAGKFLKDPWKWPQIWQMNQERIKDPHWIYPGDVIRLDRSGANPTLSIGGPGGSSADTGPSGGTSSEAAANVVKVEPRVRVESLDSAIPSIPGSTIAPFLTNPLIVEAGGMDNAPTILATEESRVVIGAGDNAYADRIGSNDGVNWQVYRPGTALRDPETGELLGYEAKYIGDARVRRFGNPTTLEITKARQEINRGDRLMPSRETSFPSYVPRAPDKLIKGIIMSVDSGVSEFGQYQVITINRGARDGIEVGHVLASYRRGHTVDSTGRILDPEPVGGGGNWNAFKGWRIFSGGDTTPVPVVPDSPQQAAEARPAGTTGGAVLASSRVRLPDERNGLIFVFRVFEKMSYAMVLRSSRPIYIGDYVQTP
jgi:hypothetical protein